MNNKPIIALCTAQGSGAIALIRISGENAIEIVDKITKLSSKKKLIDQKSHTIHHGHIIDPEKKNFIIDEVLFLLMKAPKTFTGENTVEISCHNNHFVINEIIMQAIKHGARPAERGEFSKQAFLNHKIDLLQAEAINDLIAAQTETSLKKSIAQMKGTLSNHVEKIEQDLIALLSIIEASFEFLDEEQQDLDFENIITQNLKNIITKTEIIMTNFAQQQQIRQGVRIALIGSTNVGKSTLFNTLANQEKAIVTKTPGTTRDAIETTQYKGGHFLSLIDTAGLRKTNNSIEQQGIDRSWQEAAQSDIILLIFDATKTPTPEQNELYKKIQDAYLEKLIIVGNKIDKLKESQHPKLPLTCKDAICISAKNKNGIAKLEAEIEAKIQNLCKTAQAPYLLNQRQHNIVLELNVTLNNIAHNNRDFIHHEIIAQQIKQTIELIGQMTGKNVTEKVMDNVFNTFCIGK